MYSSTGREKSGGGGEGLLFRDGGVNRGGGGENRGGGGDAERGGGGDERGGGGDERVMAVATKDEVGIGGGGAGSTGWAEPLWSSIFGTRPAAICAALPRGAVSAILRVHATRSQ